MSYQLWLIYLQLAGMVVEALDMTGTAHQMSIQGITAFVWLICQLHPTVLYEAVHIYLYKPNCIYLRVCVLSQKYIVW
jgi:hypothetical protein